MRRLSPLFAPLFPALLVLILLAACGAPAPGATGPGGATAGPGATPGGGGPTAGPGATPGPAATQSGGGGTEIPASCAAGFTDYLKYIEPATTSFDPATATMSDFQAVELAVQEKDYELLDTHGGATYSCSEVGLEFAYFDMNSPWAAIHQIAAAEAPGTVGYLKTVELIEAADFAEMVEFGLSCDAAAARIKGDVAAYKADGAETVGDLTIDAALPFMRLYNAYNNEIREERCPRDVLGNDEFGFMSVF